MTITINHVSESASKYFSGVNVIRCTCGCCGGVIEDDNTEEVDGAKWHADCADEHAVECDNCYSLTKADTVVDVDGHDWCPNCAEEEAYRCDRCMEYHEYGPTSVIVGQHLEHPFRWVDDTEEWCDDCVDYHSEQCTCCGKRFSDDTNRITPREMWNSCEIVAVCDDCLDNKDEYRVCACCGCLVEYDEAEYSDYNDDWYCPNCYDEHDCGDNVHDYGHTDGCYFWDIKNGTITHGYNSDGRLFIGIELETAYNDDISELADNIIEEFSDEKFECKKDCSLGDCGLEIVSQPMTPRFHIESNTWERVIDYVHEQNGSSHDGGLCGLHMHINKDFLDDGATYRIDRLFHRFRNEFINFSRRTSFGYCHLDEDDLHEIADVEERKKEWTKKREWKDRYEAINTQNYHTVEIRLWRGTLNVETFMATVEMTAGLAYVVNAMSDEFADELDWERLKLLVRYALEENDLSHTEFDAYIKRRNL